MHPNIMQINREAYGLSDKIKQQGIFVVFSTSRLKSPDVLIEKPDRTCTT